MPSYRLGELDRFAFEAVVLGLDNRESLVKWYHRLPSFWLFRLILTVSLPESAVNVSPSRTVSPIVEPLRPPPPGRPRRRLASKALLRYHRAPMHRANGEITALFIAHRRKEPREPVDSLELLVDHGVAGDAHAGPGDRQVVLFEEAARSALEEANERGLCYARFHENLRVAGLALDELQAGDRLGCGEATLEVTSARKRCYEECSLSRADCHILSHVAFARVLAAGTVSVGSPVSKRATKLPRPETESA